MSPIDSRTNAERLECGDLWTSSFLQSRCFDGSQTLWTVTGDVGNVDDGDRRCGVQLQAVVSFGSKIFDIVRGRLGDPDSRSRSRSSLLFFFFPASGSAFSPRSKVEYSSDHPPAPHSRDLYLVVTSSDLVSSTSGIDITTDIRPHGRDDCRYFPPPTVDRRLLRNSIIFLQSDPRGKSLAGDSAHRPRSTYRRIPDNPFQRTWKGQSFANVQLLCRRYR